MKHIAGWFRRNNTIMAQAKDLSRQLQEAWEDASCQRTLKEVSEESNMYLHKQLHRVARERDNERKLRLEAEEHYDELILSVEKKHPGETRHETALRYIGERENQECRAAMSNDKIEQSAEELRDAYLEELENEEE